jgi:hypothetical protein
MFGLVDEVVTPRWIARLQSIDPELLTGYQASRSGEHLYRGASKAIGSVLVEGALKIRVAVATTAKIALMSSPATVDID